jgi:hypothetical protein
MGVSRCSHSAWRLCFCLAWLPCIRARAADATAQAELATVVTSHDLISDGPSGQAGAAHVEAGRTLFERHVGPHGGQENRARLELGTDDAGFLAGIETGARLRLELSLDPVEQGTAVQFRDAGSWLSIGFSGTGWRWRLQAFPIDTDDERLGYLHALDWGGTDVSGGESIFVQQEGGVPGLQLLVATHPVELFAGLRWARATRPGASSDRLWGFTLGGSLRLLSSLHVDLGLGYFERSALTAAPGAPQGFVEGASLRLRWHRGPAEPELGPEPFRPVSLREAKLRFAPEATPGFALALEAVMLATRLRRFEAPEQIALDAAPGAALYGSLRGRALAGHAALLWRSLAFVLRNDPGIVRGETSPRASRELAEIGAWAGISVTLDAWQLTPSVELGVLAPAALQVPSPVPGLWQTFLAHEDHGVTALPVGSSRLPIALGRVALRWQASASTALGGLIDYERDPNRIAFRASTRGAVQVFSSPDSLTLSALAQARF